MPDPISIVFDAPDHVSAEPGWATEGILKQEIDRYNLTDCWVEPQTGTVMAMPLQLTDEYQTAATGEMARLRADDFGDPPDWEEYSYRFAGDWFLSAKAVGKSATTSQTWPDNQPFWLAFYVPGKPGWDGVVCEFRFANARDTEIPLTARISAEGRIDLLEGTNVKWSGWITNRRRSLIGQMVTLMVLPFRRNAILFWSNQGGSALYEDPAISEISDDSGYRITTGAAATVSFPESRGVFQLMGLKFKSDFTLSLRDPVSLPYAPTIEPDTSDFEWDVPSGTGLSVNLMLPDGSPPVFDGDHRDYRWEIVGAGTAAATPFVYRCPVRFPATNAYRVGAPTSVGSDLIEARRIIGRHPSQRFFRFALRSGASQPSTLNRSVIASLGADELFRGLTVEPRKLDSGGALRFLAQDLWKRLERVILRDARAYDGERLVDAVRDLLSRAGLEIRDRDANLAYATDEIDLAGDDPTRLPRARRDQSPRLRPNDGESVAEFLLALKAAFCRDWTMEFQPVPTPDGHRVKFRCHPPDPAPVSQGIFYLTTASAASAGSSWVVRELEFEQTEPKANEVRVLGVDALGNSVEATSASPADQSPDSDESDRGPDWVGERWLALRRDRAIDTVEAAQALGEKLLGELGRGKTIARWTAPLAPALWPGMRVTLEAHGDFEILAIDTRFDLESGPNPDRPTRYLAAGV